MESARLMALAQTGTAPPACIDRTTIVHAVCRIAGKAISVKVERKIASPLF
jgi:hypothetical protein